MLVGNPPECPISLALNGNEECKDVGNGAALVVIRAVIPVMQVLGKIRLLGRPK